MKQLNQFEASIQMLNKNIPIFVKTAYSAFMTVTNELLSKINSNNTHSAYSVNKVLTEFFNGSRDNLFETNRKQEIKHDVLSTLIGFTGDNNAKQIALLSYLTSMLTIVDGLENVEQPCAESPDFYMPLSEIKGGFTNIDNGFSSQHMAMPSIVIQPVNTNKIASPKFGSQISSTVVENSLGYKTILDDYRSECIIDIFDLFRLFYTMAASSSTTTEDDVDVGDIDPMLSKFETIYARLNDAEFMNSTIDTVSKMLLKSAISTYLVFAGKIIGNKSDLCGWLYTFFVKDSMRDVEKGDYPTSSDITLQARMQTLNDLQDMSKPNKHSSDMNNDSDMKNINSSRYKIRMYNGMDPSFDASIFYKNIRLLYSNWATVINVIIRMSNSYDTKRTVYDDETENDLIGGRNKFQHSTIYSDHIAIARAILQTYITCRFRTYNTIYQLNMDKNAGSIPSNKLISVGINSITDMYAKEIVKDYCKNKTDFFIPYDASIESVFNSNRAETCILADKFMATAYLIMLDYLHTHQEEIISQDDPDTGKPKRELFEEIYYKLSNVVNKFVSSKEKLPIGLMKCELISGTILSSGKYSAIPFDKSYMNNANIMSDKSDNYAKTFDTQELNAHIVDNKDLNEQRAYAMVGTNFVVPPFSDSESIYSKLVGINIRKQYELTDTDMNFKQFQTRAVSLFPKNEVIIDQLVKTRFNTSTVFNSIESVCDKLEESIESEWAHMGYSELADMVPTVIESETTCETSVKDAGSEVPSTEEPLLSEADLHTVNVGDENKILRHDVDLKTGCIAECEPKDSEVIKEISEESVVLNRFNKLFNKIVFGIK